MDNKFATRFAFLTVLTAIVLGIPLLVISCMNPVKKETPVAPIQNSEPVAMFFNSNDNNYITACTWCGPFEAPPELAQLQEPVVGKPATPATVWRDFFAKGDIINLADDITVRNGQYYLFDIMLGVYPENEGDYTLSIKATGEMQFGIDGNFIYTVPESKTSYFNDFSAPGHFSSTPRRITLAIKTRYGGCGFHATLWSGAERRNSISILRWVGNNAPGNHEVAARCTWISPENGGVLGSDNTMGIHLRLEGGLPLGYSLGDCTVETSIDKEKASQVVINGDELRSGSFFRIRVPRTKTPKTDMMVKLMFDGKIGRSETVSLYSPSNYAEAIPLMAERLKKYEAGKGKNPDLTLKLEQMSVALSQLKRLMGMSASESYVLSTAQKLDKVYSSFHTAIAALEVNDDPYRGVTGEVERGYFSTVDGFVQPYKVYLPPDYYTAPRIRPAVFFLHGYVVSYNLADWGEGVEEFISHWHKKGAVVFQPFGRTNTDFQTCGETDIIDVYRIAIEQFRCDPRRVYLIGVSMGGMGVWTIAARYPDKFAAIVPLAGRTDFYFWHDTKPELHPFFYNLQVQFWNPMHHIPSYRYQNIIIGHGEDDYTVEPWHSYKMSERLDQAGIPNELVTIKGDHGAAFGLLEDKELCDKIEKFVRHQGDAISFRSYLPKYAKRAWLSVEQFEKWGDPCEVFAEINEGKANIRLTNVRQFKIHPWPGVLFPGSKLGLTINDVDKGTITVLDAGVVIDMGEAAKDDQLAKRPHICGPAFQVTSEPFALVYGNEESEEAAKKFDTWWRGFAKGKCRRFAASEITPAIAGQYHLVLFGDAVSNPYLASIADRLPVKITDKAYVMPDGSEYDRENRGLVFIYPNPDFPDNLVMVCCGTPWGTNLPINHRFDFVPDYIVFEGNIVKDTDIENWLVAGYFDVFWRFSKDLMEKKKVE